jgi:large subunit ribosomal protein L22
MMKTGVKKLNQLAFLIKGLDVDQAILQLMFCKRDDAVEVIWALQEGARIAKEIQMMEPSNLFVAYTYLCRGSYYKKIDIKGRGRMGRIRSPETYMVIMLREKAARVLNQRPKPKDIRVPFPNPRKPINNPRIKI